MESEERSDQRPIIHWIPTQIARTAELSIPESDEVRIVDGCVENFELEVGEIYQLERVGFARLESLPEKGSAKFLWLHG